MCVCVCVCVCKCSVFDIEHYLTILELFWLSINSPSELVRTITQPAGVVEYIDCATSEE